MKHKVGQLVVNPKLGLGKVLEVRGSNVTVFFKDQKENPRTINVSVVPMPLAKDQADPYFDTPKRRRSAGAGSAGAGAKKRPAARPRQA